MKRPAILASLALSCATQAADFETEVRPLLQKHCVECHGAKKQKGELRLDARSFAFKGGHGGPAVAPGDKTSSLLFKRITSRDEDEMMPPTGERLSPGEIEKIAAWIQEGALWTETEADRAASRDTRAGHWAVQPLRSSFPPEAGVDYFIRRGLDEKGLSMAPQADRRTLIRRLYFDLTGLPPTPEQVEQFEADPSPEAYEKLVETLLASPRYGERWARHWLDIAHYADTHGFERDQLRPNAWRYRDYVIQSLNADKPYDQFLREQIAGDILASEKSDSIIATGFLAAGPWDFVGQVEARSEVLKRAARAGDLDDMVTQVITSTMAITINCARCHDHKLDPISQKEYFSLQAVFAGLKRDNREIRAGETERIQNEKKGLESALAEARKQIAKINGEAFDLADMVAGGDGRGSGIKGTGIVLGKGAFSKEKTGYQRNIAPNTLQEPAYDKSKTAPRMIKGVFLPNGSDPENRSVKITPEVSLPDIPKTTGDAWDAIREGGLNAQVHAKIGAVDFRSAGHSLLGIHANGGIVFDLDEVRKAGGGANLVFTAQAGFGASPSVASTKADFTVYVDGTKALERTGLKKNDTLNVEVKLPASARFLTLMATDGGDGIGSDLFFLGDPRLAPELAPAALTDAARGELERLKAEASRLEKAVKSLPQPEQVYAVTSAATPPVVRIHVRGNPEQEGDEVQPASFAWSTHAPASLGDNATPEGQRRLALAKWITDPGNPLTRRVIVNRLWQHLFGRGIVPTPSDFGLGGQPPSHPELLDWLAQELLANGWSLKKLQRLILLSDSYRQQSSTPNPGAQSLDASNRLVWRQNPRRLDAESLRDSVLSTSGRLNLAAGGPGFRDFKYTEAYAPIYEYKTEDDPEVQKRSIYRFVVRTTPHQFLTTLDCPDPANLTPVRSQTTTALQALTLSNNAFMLQQARHLAARAENETAPGQAAVRRAFQLALLRHPTHPELKAAERLASEQGLFALCRMLLNANEFMYLD
jgi:cytochrome c553